MPITAPVVHSDPEVPRNDLVAALRGHSVLTVQRLDWADATIGPESRD